MTSQVILLNSYGVAIASDTAVTSGDQVLDGVEKILRLPEPHKLALVVSGNANLMGVPWETIIYAWSKTLTKPLETLESYWASLRSWLEEVLSKESTVKASGNDAIHRAIYFTELELYKHKLLPFLRETLNQGLDLEEWEALQGGFPSEDLVTKITGLLTFEEFSALTADMESASEKSWQNIDQDIVGHYQKVVETYFVDRAVNSEIAFEEFFMSRWPHATNFAPYLLENATLRLALEDPENESVLCFAGYGMQELFPSILKVSILSMFGRVVEHRDLAFFRPGPGPHFVSLGQNKALLNQIMGYGDEMLELFIDAEQPELQEIVTPVPYTLARRLESSPLRNLGVFAGSLVSIQAAFATIEQPNPTVGGAIDIATINLREGFRWLQHDG